MPLGAETVSIDPPGIHPPGQHPPACPTAWALLLGATHRHHTPSRLIDLARDIQRRPSLPYITQLTIITTTSMKYQVTTKVRVGVRTRGNWWGCRSGRRRWHFYISLDSSEQWLEPHVHPCYDQWWTLYSRQSGGSGCGWHRGALGRHTNTCDSWQTRDLPLRPVYYLRQ